MGGMLFECKKYDTKNHIISSVYCDVYYTEVRVPHQHSHPLPPSVLVSLPLSPSIRPANRTPCLPPSSLSVSLYVLAVVYEQFCDVCVTRLDSRIEGPVTVLRGGGTGVEGE